MPRFTFRADEIPFKREEKYVGVVLNSTLHNIFANHYKKQANAAQSSAHGGLFGLEHYVGRGNIHHSNSILLSSIVISFMAPMFALMSILPHSDSWKQSKRQHCVGSWASAPVLQKQFFSQSWASFHCGQDD
ncbi:hypothetical protein BDZ89DRAFT_1120440 [Hymenopellis radicata]|nr:hypothetical protein BDZ89DRAFT_1120440 [Hymenopellis radicata]